MLVDAMNWGPAVVPGDLIEIAGVQYPRGSGKIKEWLGLYDIPGHPSVELLHNPTATGSRQEIAAILNDHCIGQTINEERGLVVATLLHQEDGRWYYLLRMGHQQGWTRSGIRLKKIGTV